MFVQNYFGKMIDNPKFLGIIQSCMDMKKVCRIPDSGNLPDLTGARLLVGAKQLRKGILAGQVWVRTKAELGRACGIEVGAAAAGAAEQ